MTPPVEYLAEKQVTSEDDRRLRAILSTCYGGAGNEMFSYRRYWQEPPQHRWIMRAADRSIVSHLAVHDKVIGTENGDLRIGGVALVCTAVDYRRQGYAKKLLWVAHEWMMDAEIPFSLLFAVTDIYKSSGYRSISNPIRFWDWREKKTVVRVIPSAMVIPLAVCPWPDGLIDLRGPDF